MNELTKKLNGFIEGKNWKLLKKELKNMNHYQIFETISNLSKSNQIILFRVLSSEQAKAVFQNLSSSEKEDIIMGFAKKSHEAAKFLNNLNPDDRTAFFEELPDKISQELLKLMSPKAKAITIRLLGYPEDSIGRLMTTEYVAIKSYFSVKLAIEHIREFGHKSETLDIIYIIDENWKLIDDIKIRDIILADPEKLISELIDNSFVALNVYDDQEIAIKKFKEQDRVALPVVDNNNTLLGIVTIDDVVIVDEEETTEDFHKFGSIQQGIVNPLKAKIGYLYKKRIFWLLALVFVNIFSGAAIANFEEVIQSHVSLVFFLPLLIDSGGNAGSQSATLMIRSLALGSIRTKDWAKLLGKELIVSLFLGITMALGVSFIASFRAAGLVTIVSLTMVLTVMAGSLIGMLLPFIFTKLKTDPATASAPLITSICDILGVLIYFSIASWYLCI